VGLGLAITDQAIRLHGGSVRASNLAEGGLLVEMHIPLQPGQGPQEQRAAVVASKSS
jgi:signal transduction histidine kinase